MGQTELGMATASGREVLRDVWYVIKIIAVPSTNLIMKVIRFEDV